MLIDCACILVEAELFIPLILLLLLESTHGAPTSGRFLRIYRVLLSYRVTARCTNIIWAVFIVFAHMVLLP